MSVECAPVTTVILIFPAAQGGELKGMYIATIGVSSCRTVCATLPLALKILQLGWLCLSVFVLYTNRVNIVCLPMGPFSMQKSNRYIASANSAS